MSLNKIQLIGNVGKDPQQRQVQEAVGCSFTVATTEKGFLTKEGNQVPDRTEWHTCSLFGKLAEIALKYVHKGDKIYIEGKYRMAKYLDKQTNVEKSYWYVDVQNFELMQNQRPATQPMAQQPMQQPMQQQAQPVQQQQYVAPPQQQVAPPQQPQAQPALPWEGAPF